ncbi:glutamine--fructose-6-phosphate transaminase (isomerizing) [Penicillium herquei]|nr:glutamine--fructose-6-phosphate transaminase (isomerizing) [Penicillium herquei]
MLCFYHTGMLLTLESSAEEGLSRLEYRGYDSSGLVVDGDSGLDVLAFKEVGKVAQLRGLIESSPPKMDIKFETHVGIAHTRWATHGPPSRMNCHPHRLFILRSDNKWEFAVVHNGIITNYKELKAFLLSQGLSFETDTDTECISKLAKYIRSQRPDIGFLELVRTVVGRLQGSFGMLIKSSSYPNQVIATRKGSPLIIGIRMPKNPETDDVRISDASNGVELDTPLTYGSYSASSILQGEDSLLPNPAEFFLSSDASAIIEHTRQVIYLEDNDIAHIWRGHVKIVKIVDDESKLDCLRKVETIDLQLQDIMKGSYNHFMQKEIFEQPESVANTMCGRLNDRDKRITLDCFDDYIPIIRNSRRIIFIACGTSYHSCMAVRGTFESLTELPTVVELASDFLDRKAPIFRDDTCIFVSQSGETADSLLALKYCSKRGALTLGIVNCVGSSVARLTQCVMYINAGPEIGVASTKAYTSQFVAMIMLALALSEEDSHKKLWRDEIIHALTQLPEQIAQALRLDAVLRQICDIRLRSQSSILLWGRGSQFATALEGALKIKEVSYLHCEAINPRDIHHGCLTPAERRIPIIMALSDDTSFQFSEVYKQVIAHGGSPLVICSSSEKSLHGLSVDSIKVPKTVDALQGILNIIPLQLMAYWLAVSKGLNVDCPRNLAKSVTVE